MRRYLKPGGLVYISYNVLPEWASVTPMQWLLLEQGKTGVSGSEAQIRQGRELIDRLRNEQSGYFATHNDPFLQYRLDRLADAPTAYLAHEYLNQGWEALYHADVARDLAAAKLEFSGSATFFKALPHLYLSPQQQALLASIPNRGLRETTRDFLHASGLRRDIFVRGRRPMTPARQSAWLGKIGLAPTKPRDACTIEADPWLATENQFSAVLDALKNGPRTWHDLVSLAALGDQPQSTLIEIAVVLEHSAIASPYLLGAANQDRKPAHRLNLAIAQQTSFDDRYQALASPLLGNGTVSGLMQRLVYAELEQQTGDIDVAGLAAKICAVMNGQDTPILRDGEPLGSTEDELAHVAWTIDAIRAQREPVWQGLPSFRAKIHRCRRGRTGSRHGAW